MWLHKARGENTFVLTPSRRGTCARDLVSNSVEATHCIPDLAELGGRRFRQQENDQWYYDFYERIEGVSA
jgi:hypothetical protein